MNFSKYKWLVDLIKIAGLAYIINKLVFYIFKVDQDLFQYRTEVLYLFFIAFSVILFLVLEKIRKVNFDNVGMSFLLGTTIKILPCYLLLKPILNSNSKVTEIEKINFFILFILFLTIETLLTIRILSKKE